MDIIVHHWDTDGICSAAIIGRMLDAQGIEWKNYTPQPLHFIHNPKEATWDLNQLDIDKNLKYVIKQLDEKKKIEPNWEWDMYPNHWKLACRDWSGVLTLRAMRYLKIFHLLEFF